MANVFEIAQLWAERLQDRNDAKTGILQYANREYEGRLRKAGDTVTVEEVPLITWGTASATHTAAYTEVNTTATNYDIQVAQGKTIRHPIADIEEIRASFQLGDGIMDSILESLKQTHETHFLTQMATDAANTVLTAALANTTIIAKIEAMGVLLDEDNAPNEGRILAVTPAVASALRQSGIYVYTESGQEKIKDGMAPDIAGFKAFVTNLGPASTIIGFVTNKPHFIEQLTGVTVRQRDDNLGYNILGASYYQAKTVGSATKCLVKHVYS